MVVALSKLWVMDFEDPEFRWDECLLQLLFQPLKKVS